MEGTYPFTNADHMRPWLAFVGPQDQRPIDDETNLMTTKPQIIIIGAGIGGLTAAIALRQAGFGIRIFERAAEVKEIGAGLVLSANAVRVLKHLDSCSQSLTVAR